MGGPGDTGAALIARIRANGLTVTISARGGIQVRPKARITPDMDRWIRAHRDAMAEALRAEQRAGGPSSQNADAAPDAPQDAGPISAAPPNAGPLPAAGRHSGGYTAVPNILLDYILPSLGLAERAVLLYLWRRLAGFHRESDVIALAQICRGITSAEGDELDWGTGLSRSNVQAALDSLA
ncbi:MAG TPA: hypothetical protein VHB98_07610, partial [Chloroflexota bacterium]|nr:hypothetical protein [Chloroflexota bacterium]